MYVNITRFGYVIYIRGIQGTTDISIKLGNGNLGLFPCDIPSDKLPRRAFNSLWQSDAYMRQ